MWYGKGSGVMAVQSGETWDKERILIAGRLKEISKLLFQKDLETLFKEITNY